MNNKLRHQEAPILEQTQGLVSCAEQLKFDPSCDQVSMRNPSCNPVRDPSTDLKCDPSCDKPKTPNSNYEYINIEIPSDGNIIPSTTHQKQVAPRKLHTSRHVPEHSFVGPCSYTEHAIARLTSGRPQNIPRKSSTSKLNDGELLSGSNGVELD